jgi:hypothetical protein
MGRRDPRYCLVLGFVVFHVAGLLIHLRWSSPWSCCVRCSPAAERFDGHGPWRMAPPARAEWLVEGG